MVEDAIMSRMIISNTSQLTFVLSNPGGYLPVQHLARFVDLAVERLDLSEIVSREKRQSNRGRSNYDPVMMTKLVLYGYCTGVVSERGIEEAVRERFDFNFLAGGNRPDSSKIGKFKSRNLASLAKLYQPVLEMAVEARLVDLKVVAIDGTKMLADASKHKAMSIDRLRLSCRKLPREIAKIRRQLKRLSSNSSKRKKLIEDLDFKTARLATVRQAKVDLEERMKDDAERKAQEKGQQRTGNQIRRRTKAGKKTKDATKQDASKAKQKESRPQINFTDKESRIMKMGNGWGQCYNAQAAVDRKAQIIVAHSVTNETNDKQQWEPNLRAVGENLGLLPDNGLGDTGYFSESNVTAPALASTNVLIPPNRQRDSNKPVASLGRMPKSMSTAERMRRKLQTTEGKELYGMRKSTVEPVYGQIKAGRQRFRQFSFRGLTKAGHEWALICLAHNLTKIFRSGWQPSLADQPAAA
jgi:transposase